MLDHAARGRRRERVVPVAPVLLDVALERLAEQFFLVAEGGVQAWGIDPHCLGQFGNGRTLVAIPPEHLQRMVERPVHIEFTWTSHAHKRLPSLLFECLFYRSLYKWLTASVQYAISVAINASVGDGANSCDGKLFAPPFGGSGLWWPVWWRSQPWWRAPVPVLSPAAPPRPRRPLFRFRSQSSSSTTSRCGTNFPAASKRSSGLKSAPAWPARSMPCTSVKARWCAKATC